MSLLTLPFTAPASIQPCELYLDHGSARPAFTQGHHRFPEYLQKRLWGEIRNKEIIWMCGTCHDNLHGWLYMLMGEWRQTVQASEVPPRARALADSTLLWYKQNAA